MKYCFNLKLTHLLIAACARPVWAKAFFDTKAGRYSQETCVTFGAAESR